MPIVDVPQLPLTTMTGEVRPPWESPDVAPAPVTENAPSLLGAALRQGNSAVSALSSRTLFADNSVDPHFDVKGMLDGLIGTKYEGDRERFLDANNAAYATQLKQQIDTEQADKATLEASPWMGFAANIGAMATDPLMYIPFVGEAAKGVEVGTGAVRAGVQAAVHGGLGVALQEGALQATQQTRPLSESAINIGMGTALAGFLGGAGHGLISAGDMAVEKRAVQNLADVASGKVDGVTGEAKGLSAQAVEKPTNADLSISGRATSRLAAMTSINPVLRTYQRASSVARDTLLNLYENTLYSARNDRGLSNTPLGAAETEYKQLLGGRMSSAIGEENAIFKQMKQDGVTMSRSQFQDEIGNAMRRGDVGVNDYVSRAATVYRTKVMDPFKDDLIKEGQLPAGVAPQDAVSYFSRMWNQKKLIAREGAFKDLVQPHIEQMLAEQHAQHLQSLQAGMARIEQAKSDLNLTPEERTTMLDSLKAQGEALDAANPQHVDTYNKLLDIGRSDRAAKEAGTYDYRTKAASDAERARLNAEGGAGLQAYRAAQRNLRSRMRDVDFGAAGLEMRQQNILQRLTDLEAANERSLQSLIDRGRAFQKITQKFDQGRIDKMVEGYRSKFEDLVRESDRSLQNTEDRITKLQESTATKTQKLNEQAAAYKAQANASKNAEANLRKAENAYKAAASQVDKRQQAHDQSAAALRDAKKALGKQEATPADQTRIEALNQNHEANKEALAAAKQDAKARKSETTAARNVDPMAKPALDQKTYEAKVKSQEADLEADKRELALLEASRTSQAAYADRIGRLHERLENASAIDSEAAIEAARAANDELLRVKGSMALSRGEKAQRMLTTLDKLDPERVKTRMESLDAEKVRRIDAFNERWRGAEGDPMDPTGVGFKEHAKSIVDAVFDKISGRYRPGEGSEFPDWIVPLTKGPMKDKTFHIPDTVVEDYLHSNVRMVAHRYARSAAGEISLARRFDGDPTMKTAIANVNAHYGQLSQQISDAPDLKSALEVIGKTQGWLSKQADVARGKVQGLDPDAVSRERLLSWLENDRKSAVADIGAGRDMVRGTYKLAENNGKFGKFVQATNMLNYIRLSGGFVASSISELYLAAFAHGLAPFLHDYVRPLLSGLKGLKNIDEELHLAGLANESTMHGHLMSSMEIGDPYAEGNAFQRLLKNGTNLASKFNGMGLYQDFEERMAGRIGMQRMLKAVLKDNPGEKDAKWLAGVEISPTMQDRIAKQFAQHGQTDEGIHMPNTEQWTDDTARDVFRNALQKHVTTIVVKPGFGDLPLGARTPLGKMMMQFRTFSMAAHQRTTLRAMQDGPAHLLSGFVGTTALGMMAAYISAARSGKDNFERWMTKAENNPMWWITEGVDRGGIIPLLMEGANDVEKVSSTTGVGNSFNPIKTPISKAFGASGGQSSRVASRDIFTTLLGPSAGLLTSSLQAAGAGASMIKGEDIKAAQKKALVNLAPFGSFLGVKEGLQFLTGESPLQ